MRAIIQALLVGVVAVLSAHAIAYALISVLPDSATVSLGIFSVQEEAVSAFGTDREHKDYLDTMGGLLQGDLGRTLDRVPVTHALADGLSESGLRILYAFGLVLGCGLLGAVLAGRRWRAVNKIASFFTFLPSFFLPLLFFSIVIYADLHLHVQVSDPVFFTLTILAIATGPAFLVLGQTLEIFQVNLVSLHAVRHYSAGASEFAVRRRLLRNWLYEIAPTLEKVLVLITTSLVFTEPIFSLPGVGTTIIRAVRRSDVELMLGCVLLFAVIINGARVLSVATRVGLAGGRS